MHGAENTINQNCPGQHLALSSGLRVQDLRHLNRLTPILVLAWALLWADPALSGGDRFDGFSTGGTISIRADNAWEDVTPDTIHFSGHFELKANDWYLSADHATLFGDLDDPETAILTGSPATIQLETTANDRIETITGQAARIVYQRVTNSITLEGGASLSRAGQLMQSEEIEYDIEQDRIQAGGSQGVHIRVNPED